MLFLIVEDEESSLMGKDRNREENVFTGIKKAPSSRWSF